MFVAVIFGVLYYFLKTQLGLALRACGDNEDMVKASSINADLMKILGLSLSNGLVALSGAIYAQHQSFADSQSGTYFSPRSRTDTTQSIFRIHARLQR